MYQSHEQARVLFDATVDNYQKRSDANILNFSSLIFQRRIAIVKELLQDVPAHASVLDFGMGPAVFGPYCDSRNWRYVGVDISPQMIERARALNLANAEFVVGDLDSLGAYAGQMDVVMAIGLIDYLEHPEEGMRALERCLKPGGIIVLSFRNRWSVPRILRDSSKRVVRLAVGGKNAKHHTAFLSDVHERSFSFRGELRPMLGATGIERFSGARFQLLALLFQLSAPRPGFQIMVRRGYTHFRQLDAKLLFRRRADR